MADQKKQYRLKKKIFIKGCTKVLTGLHIGGSNNALSIGGLDNAVIRNPVDNKPYIPGSSLKGKMRSLLELAYGYIMEKSMGNVKFVGSDKLEHITVKLFGNAKGGDDQRPSRVIVRDGMLTPKGEELLSNTEFFYTEGKTEVVIDRITSAAVPRQLERVPAGAEFALEIVLNIFEEDGVDEEEELITNLFKALKLVQDDYLGGSGSRGSGQVDFVIKEVFERDAAFYTSSTLGEGKDVLAEYAQKYIPESMIEG